MSRLHQWLRYGAVSIIATLTSQCVLAVLVSTRATSPVLGNVIATAAGIVPSFELNRRWVWRRTGRPDLGRQIAPFVVLSLAGLLLSSLSVALVARRAASSGLEGTARTLAIEAANLAAFGLLWLVQFAVLDRLLFRHPGAVASSMPDPARGEAHAPELSGTRR